MKNQNGRRAFTIVELVIVIAVIAILAAVLIPVFAGVIDSAHDSKAVQNAQAAYIEYLMNQLTDGTVSEHYIYESDDGRVVALSNGASLGIFDSISDAKKALVDDPDTPENESEHYITTPVLEDDSEGGILYAVIEKEDQSGNDKDDNGSDDDNSNDSNDTTAQDTVITGVEIIGAEFDSESNTYRIVYDTPLTIKVTGKNLDKYSQLNVLYIGAVKALIFEEGEWNISSDGTSALLRVGTEFYDELKTGYDSDDDGEVDEVANGDGEILIGVDDIFSETGLYVDFIENAE